MSRTRPDFSAQFQPSSWEGVETPFALGDPFAFSGISKNVLQAGFSLLWTSAFVAATSFAAGVALGYAIGSARPPSQD